MNAHSFLGESASVSVSGRVASEPRRLPRVLYVLNLNPTDKFGALEEQIVFLHQAFQEEGSCFAPLFICPAKAGMTDGFRRYGVAAHCLDLRSFRWSTLAALRGLIRSGGFEIVHWHFTEPLANPYLWWLSVLNPTVRHFFSDHISRPSEPYTPPTSWKRLLKRLLLKCYARTLCVSRFVHDCLMEQGSWSNVDVCRHFINTDRFVPDATVHAAMRRRHDVADRFVVTVIAQLIHEKGIDVVLRAMIELPDRAILWIIGSGCKAEELQALSRTLGVDHRVRFLGLQRHVEPFLQASDCFVLPSRWKEAAGLVLLEAQSVGLPVVASRIGGIPEYVDDGQTGFLFAPEDSGELAVHLRALCADADLCRRMGQRGRTLAVEQFSPPTQLSDWLNYYR